MSRSRCAAPEKPKMSTESVAEQQSMEEMPKAKHPPNARLSRAFLLQATGHVAASEHLHTSSKGKKWCPAPPTAQPQAEVSVKGALMSFVWIHP